MQNTRTKYHKQDRSYWSKHISAWQQSGLSQSEYCRQKDIPLTSFGNWKSKLNIDSVTASQFVELRSHFPERDDYFELHLEGDITIRIRESISQTSLRNIIIAVRSV